MSEAFYECREIESRGRYYMVPFLRDVVAKNGQFVDFDTGNHAKEFQHKYGDAAANIPHLVCVEFKCEEENRYGNFFLETWSNKGIGRGGWLYTSECDELWYFFIKQERLFRIDFPKLRKWAVDENGIEDCREVGQGKYEQRNDTWGKPVMIRRVMMKAGISEHDLSEFAPGEQRSLFLSA